MKRVLLLEGPRGVGKSTLLLEAMGPCAGRAGGFMTLRLPGENRRGFCHVKPSELQTPTGGELRGDEKGLFLMRDENGVTRFDDVLLTHTLPMLEDIASHPFAVLDEIGGLELTLPPFHDALYRAIDQPVPLLGVLKCRENSQTLGRREEAFCDYRREYEAFRSFLENHGEVEIVSVQSVNDGIRQRLALWLEAHDG